MPEKTKFRGTPIYLAGQYLILPPLSVGQLEEYDETRAARGDTPQDKASQTAETLDLIAKALSRNYGDKYTVAWLRENLDSATAKEAVEALAKLSGLTAVVPGEE